MCQEVTMQYGDKLKAALKAEQNPINKMYLNELVLNWKKVETAFQTKSEAPIISIVTAVSEYTKHLSNPKFSQQKEKGIGFPEEHDIFKCLYLDDIVERLLEEVGIKTTTSKKGNVTGGIYLKHRAFSTALRLENNTLHNQKHSPTLDFQTSEKYLHLGLEFDMQYKIVDKKNLAKTKLNIPLIVFYIEKCFTESSFREIEQLKKDTVALNPSALLFCITESVDKKLIKNYADIREIVYVTRGGFKGEAFKPLQPQVFLSLYSKLLQFTQKEVVSFEKYVPFGHIDLFQDIPLPPSEQKTPNTPSKKQLRKEKHLERLRMRKKMKNKKTEDTPNSETEQTSGETPQKPKQLTIDDIFAEEANTPEVNTPEVDTQEANIQETNTPAIDEASEPSTKKRGRPKRMKDTEE